MRIRKRCVRHGHRWWTGAPLPVQFCARWFCDGERVNPDFDMPPEMRRDFELFLARLGRVTRRRRERG